MIVSPVSPVDLKEHFAVSIPLPSEANVHNASSDHAINVTNVNQVLPSVILLCKLPF